MKLGLSMIMKNEGKKIPGCLGKIVDLFEDIVILDTGSTDNTVGILGNYGVNAVQYETSHSDKHRLIEARNHSIERNKCDWVLVMDGDEIISREDLIKIKKHISCDDNVSGYFIKFMDYRYGEPFEDYKMCLINKNKIRFLFSVHACPQVYARDNGGYGLRLNGISISHYPEYKEYREKYIRQILEGINENPGCLRFYRFLGYNYYKHGESDKAVLSFTYILDNLGVRFPVETLNSLMILSTIYQERGDHIRAFYYIQIALDYYGKVSTDFEVKINHRLLGRFEGRKYELLLDPNKKITPYEFSY